MILTHLGGSLAIPAHPYARISYLSPMELNMKIIQTESDLKLRAFTMLKYKKKITELSDDIAMLTTSTHTP